MHSLKLETYLNNQDGMVTIIALFMMIMLTLVGIGAIMIANDDISIAGNESHEMEAFYAAEAGLERASAYIQNQYEATGLAPTSMPSGNESLDGAICAYDVTDNGAAEQRPLTQGTLAGLNALVKKYTVTSTGISDDRTAQTSLTMDFEAALVPLFQFAIFYGNDLEIAPGPDMSIIGRVHSNGDLYLQAGSDLYMDSYVTCSGDLKHGRKGPLSVSNGDIFIKDTEGNYQNMKNSDGSFLTSDDANWYDEAANRWDGRVQDGAFGQDELNLPISSGDPHNIIERYDGGANPDSYELAANAKIIDGRYYVEMGGVWQDVTASLPVGTITSGSFTDQREGKTVNSTDVDMALLASSGYMPSNGVIYSSDQRAGSFNAIRLKNGADLDNNPLSIFSENPMYVEGDFNTIDKTPAALGADAITFLSNSWDDSKSDSSKYARPASVTTCNASIMTGNTETTTSGYNGGLENLPRFLENWSGVDFNYLGSLVNLWNSEQAVGAWSGTYYSPPIRNWAYDTDLDDPSKLPPNTPQIQVFQRTGWRQLDIAHSDYQYNDSAYATEG